MDWRISGSLQEIKPEGLALLLNIAIGLLSAFFFLASSIKIFGWQKKVFEIKLGVIVTKLSYVA